MEPHDLLYTGYCFAKRRNRATILYAMNTSQIRTNLEHVRCRIAAAAERAGRDPEDITLVAVTKTHPVEIVQAAYEADIRDIGENRLDEALEKQRATAALEGIRWHMIGHVKLEQAAAVVGRFALVHSVDTLKLARALNRQAMARDIAQVDVLLQANVSGEHSKYGFPADTQKGRDKLCASAADLAIMYPRLRIRGLMTMAPFVDDPEMVRPIFAGLRELRSRLARELPQADWSHLSMGMTNDFEVAVEEGATIVRVGTAIFGERKG